MHYFNHRSRVIYRFNTHRLVILVKRRGPEPEDRQGRDVSIMYYYARVTHTAFPRAVQAPAKEFVQHRAQDIDTSIASAYTCRDARDFKAIGTCRHRKGPEAA
jgi:hypothetical protein